MAWSDMEPKQKGMLIATVLLFLIIGYMVYRMFFAGSHTPPPPPAAARPSPVAAKPATPAAAPTNAATNNPAADLAVANPSAPGVNAAPAAPTVPAVVEMPKRELTPEELALLEERRQVQQQYLQLVNQYQLTEMQNKVATSQSNLLKTEIDAAKAERQAARLGLVLPGQADNTKKGLTGVSLVYVEQKKGIWGAVLNVRGAYVNVKMGSRLLDGSVVSRINESGLVIIKDGDRYPLTVPIVVDHESADQGTSSGDNSGAASSSDNGGAPSNGGAPNSNADNMGDQ